MITKEQIAALVNAFLNDTDYVLQTLEIDKEMRILVEIDRLGPVDVDFCAALNTYLVEHLDENEDYALEVGSVSLTDPFKSKLQYEKHLGHNVVVTDSEGKKHSGQLVSVDEETFIIDAKQTLTFRYDEVKTKYNITF